MIGMSAAAIADRSANFFRHIIQPAICFVNLQLSDGRQTLLLIRGRWDSMPHSLMSSSVIFGIGR
jgi:hypothetical protein